MHYSVLRAACMVPGLILCGSAICQLPNNSPEKQTAQIFTNPRKVVEIGKQRPTSIAFTPDGRLLAVCSKFGDAHFWDMTRGEPITSFMHFLNATCGEFSPDGRTFAALNGRKKIELWDVETGQLKATLVESDDLPRIAFSPDSRKIATATLSRREARIWDVQSGRLEATLVHPKELEHGNGVWNVVFSTDGKSLITSSSYTIYLWDVADGKLLSKLIDPDLTRFPTFWNNLKESSHSDSIYTLVLSPDGRILASGSRDITAKLWEVASGKLKAVLRGHKGRVWRIAFSPNGQIVATGSDDRTVKLWDTSTGSLKAT